MQVNCCSTGMFGICVKHCKRLDKDIALSIMLSIFFVKMGIFQKVLLKTVFPVLEQLQIPHL